MGMNRKDFMQQLEALLSDLSENEREEALQYYNDYFDDAGASEEEQVLNELGTPERVAKIIKDGMNDVNRDSGEFSERGYKDPRFETNYEMMKKRQGEQQKEEKYVKPSSTSTGKVILIVLLILFAIPVGIPVLLGIFGAVFGILAAIFGIFVALAATALALTFSGIVVFIVGIVKLITVPPVGIFACGIGLILTAVGLLLTLLTVLICAKVIPVCVRGFVSLCQMPFKNRRNYA